MRKPPSNSPHQLIVEGSTDLYAIIQLLGKRGFPWTDESRVRPHLEAAGSDTQALDVFKDRLRNPVFQRVGLVLDVDGAATVASRLDAVRGRLRDLEIDLGSTEVQQGVVHDLDDGRRVGIWLMPDNSSQGALEDFLASLVPGDDSLWQWAPEVVAEAISRGAQVQTQPLKSRFHSWLAWQPEPGLPFGLAIQKGLLKADHPSADAFVTWFFDLFPPDQAP